MKVGRFRIKLGVLDDSKKSISWITELKRKCTLNLRSASCSFYVPNLTSFVVAFQQDLQSINDEVDTDGRHDQHYLLKIKVGSTTCEELLSNQDCSFRLYGLRASSTGFHGKDIALIANEENLDITIHDVNTKQCLATFTYKHLEMSEAPDHIDSNVIDYNGESMAFISAPNSNVPSVAGADDEEEVDELIDSEVEAAAEDSSTVKKGKNTAPIEAKPETSKKKLKTTTGTLQGMFTPSFKADRSDSNRPKPKLFIKPEDGLEVQMSPSKPPSPPHLIRKELIQKIENYQRQFEALKGETAKLADARDKKAKKTGITFERTMKRIEEEYEAAHRVNLDHIEIIKKKIEDEIMTLKWVQDMIRETAEVIELSDDSDEEMNDDAISAISIHSTSSDRQRTTSV